MINFVDSCANPWSSSNMLPAYQILLSVDRKEGMVSMVVMTALMTIAIETKTLSAKAVLLEEGSSSNRNNCRLKGF